MKPVTKACAGPVERRVSSWVDLRAAPFTSERATGFNAVELRILAALVASVALTETHKHQVAKAAFLGWEAVHKLA